MKATLLFEEISNFVEKHYLIRPQLNYIDDKTVEVVCKAWRFVPKVSVKICIEAIRDNYICLSYECGIAIDLLLSKGIEHVKGKIPKGIDIDTDKRRVDLYLEQIDALRKTTEYVTLDGIQIKEEGLEITLGLI